MNTRFKVLSAVLPVAILAGPFGVGRLLADQTSVVPTAQTQPAPAKEPSQASQMPYTGTYLGHVTIRTDRSAVDEFTKRFKILTASAINLVSQQHEIFVEGMETLETVDAFTEKPDARGL
jgi:hypothetical protein